ncbi:MAG: transcriptional regulator, partial [Acidobacteriota bacterium]
EMEYVVDRLTEELTMRLGRVSPGRLGVVPRAEALVFRGSDESIRKVGETLGVDYIVAGSLKRGEESDILTVGLIRVRDGARLWAETHAVGTQGEGILQGLTERLALGAAARPSW